MQQTIYLTFDLETDWGGRVSPDQPCKGMDEGLPFLLDLLEKYSIKATFFISGEIAGIYHRVIRFMHLAGHEIAAHGFNHRRYSDKMSYSEVLHEVSHAKMALENILGFPPSGYRSPQFRYSIHLEDALAAAGFKYDSSICTSPFHNKRTGVHQYQHKITEHFLQPWSWLNIPPGLLWIHRIGISRYLQWLENNNDHIIYAHPFDWIKKRYDSSYNIQVNLWYNYPSYLSVQKTIQSLLIKLLNRDIIFNTLRNRRPSANLYPTLPE